MSQVKEALGGGTFLTRSLDPNELFTREDLSDEQRLFGQTAAEFMRNEVLPNEARLYAHDWQKTRELLEKIPGTQVTTVERCSGHDGTWGVKTEYFDQSMKIGRPVFRQMAEPAPDYVSSDCAIAARHIRQGMGEAPGRKEHPITLLRIAYGL